MYSSSICFFLISRNFLAIYAVLPSSLLISDPPSIPSDAAFNGINNTYLIANNYHNIIILQLHGKVNLRLILCVYMCM